MCARRSSGNPVGCDANRSNCLFTAKSPTRRGGQGSKWPESKRWEGMHNFPIGAGRESDLRMVLMKRGNSRGAKGQDFDRVFNNGESPAWSIPPLKIIADSALLYTSTVVCSMPDSPPFSGSLAGSSCRSSANGDTSTRYGPGSFFIV